MTAYISGNHICMLFMLRIGVFPLYCMSSYGGCIHLLYKLIYYLNSYMHVVQAPTIKEKLFMMAVCSPSGKTIPGNFTIIPSAKKWVFHAIYCLAFFSLYGKHICLLNQLVITDEEDAGYCSFETLILTHEMF